MSGQIGFATWNPTDASRELLGQIQAVLEEYADYLPLTGRQIFYRRRIQELLDQAGEG